MKSKLAALGVLGFAMGCGTPQDLEQSAPEPVEDVAAQGYLGYTVDQCSGLLKVLNKNGQLQTIQRGVTTRVDVASYRFRWYCGSTAEFTTCDVGTRYVMVTHSTSSRQITWACYY